MDAYNADLAAWEAALEAERVKYDRIAFSGQVPVNHIGAAVGDYIVPIPKLDGSIGTTAKALPDMSMADYAAAVGKEIGRAHVWTPGTNAQLVCRLLLEKKKTTKNNTRTQNTLRQI